MRNIDFSIFPFSRERLVLALDAVFSVIYIAVMVVYSGVLTAVTLAVVPLFLGLTYIASPLIRGQLR
jgi:ATP-binding cassette subfamily B protein